MTRLIRPNTANFLLYNGPLVTKYTLVEKCGRKMSGKGHLFKFHFILILVYLKSEDINYNLNFILLCFKKHLYIFIPLLIINIFQGFL